MVAILVAILTISMGTAAYAAPEGTYEAEAKKYEQVVDAVNEQYGIDAEFDRDVFIEAVSDPENMDSILDLEDFTDFITAIAKEQAELNEIYADVDWQDTSNNSNGGVSARAVKSQSQSATVKQSAGTYTPSFTAKVTYEYESTTMTFIKATAISSKPVNIDSSFSSSGTYYTKSNGDKTMTTKDNGKLTLCTGDGRAYYTNSNYDVFGAWTLK